MATTTPLPTRLDFTALLDQQGRLLQLHSALPQLALVPERLVFKEAVNQPFEGVVDAVGASAYFELKSLIGEPVSLHLLQADGSRKAWHGLVFDAAQLGSDGGFARYRLVVRPWLSLLALRRDARVFHDQTALQIVEAVFKRYPQACWRVESGETLRQRSLCVQYRESDLDFVSRLLAEEGLSWHFEHHGDTLDAASNARHELVITDRQAPRHALGDARFARQHVTANLTGQKDAITAFMAQRQVHSNAIARGSWNYKTLAGTAAEQSSALDIGQLPVLEHYDGSGAYRYADAEHAQRAASLALAALEQNFERFEGQGSTRHFSAGANFHLVDHPLFGANTTALNYAAALAFEAADNEFTLLAVEHHAANNLGARAAKLLGQTELERGSYKNHFHACKASTPVVPLARRKPTASGMQTALVVGVQGEAVSTERDLRVKVRFHWQRAESETSTETEPTGTWVRVAQAAAGANWGSVFVPRNGSEVAVAFIEDDIDRPIITGALYNGQDTPPFAAGVDAGVNHPGVIDGWHSQALDGQGYNQWVLDNATGQLRMRLHSSYAASEIGLGHLIQQSAGNAQRGAWRGSGFEAGTQGWASLRAGQGLLVSTSARPASGHSAQSTQMDAAEAVAQLKAANDLGSRMSQAAASAGAQNLPSHDAEQAWQKLTAQADPKQQGQHTAPVNGQAPHKTQGGRTAGDPVETFAQPLVMLDTPSSLLWATEASVASYAGQDWSLATQGDLQQSAAHTVASVSGGTSSWYAHEGGAQLIAANGNVSLRAHTDSLQILADQSVTVQSINAEITISAKSRIELVAGQSSIVLDGANIDFNCPGNWQVKGSQHAFLGGGSGQAVLPSLPSQSVKEQSFAFVCEEVIEEAYLYTDRDGLPVSGINYKLSAGGEVLEGKTSATGETAFVRVKLVGESIEVAWRDKLKPWRNDGNN